IEDDGRIPAQLGGLIEQGADIIIAAISYDVDRRQDHLDKDAGVSIDDTTRSPILERLLDLGEDRVDKMAERTALPKRVLVPVHAGLTQQVRIGRCGDG